MVRKILGTVITRIVIAAVTLAVILINSWALGAEKVGTVSLIVLAITLIQLVNGFVGGSAIVYLVPRAGIATLLLPAFIWSLFTSVTGSWILDLLRMIPDGFMMHVLFLSMILSFTTSCYMILLGQEKIRIYNMITLLQALFLVLALLFWLFILERKEVVSYIFALYVSYLFAFIASFTLILLHGGCGKLEDIRSVIRDIIRYGSVMQAGNLMQFFNYRLSYYFTEFFSGRAALGVYSVGVQLTESVWLAGKSIHLVQYSRISNEKDPGYAARLTLILTKVSFLVSLICLALLVFLIWLVFPLIFTKEFEGVRWVMAALIPGILVFSVSITLSPYFSGIGKPLHNTVSAAVGLIFTIVSGLILIPKYGFIGAGASASVSYAAATLYQFLVFIRLSKISPAGFLLTRADISGFTTLIREYLKKDIPGNRMHGVV